MTEVEVDWRKGRTPAAYSFTVAGMKPSTKPLLSEEEQTILDEVSLGLIEPEEHDHFDGLICREHYLRRADRVGEQLRYVAEYRGPWVARLAWIATAFHRKDREAWIGWTVGQKRRRLTLGVNHSRFLLRTEGRVPNLASRVMKLRGQRRSADGRHVYGHAVLVAESFVDRQRFRGTCYQASGWTLPGQTQGYRRARQDSYVAHERPKQLRVRELRPGARTILRGRNLPAALKALAEGQVPECPQSPETLGWMRGFFAGLPDWRTKQGAYARAGLVTIVVGAAVCGVHRGQRDWAAFVAHMTVAQWAARGLPRRGNPRRGWVAQGDDLLPVAVQSE